MMTCKYQTCGATGEFGDAGACPKCVEIAEQIRDRICQGLITAHQREDARLVRERGKVCAACDKKIGAESHWVSGDHRFHETCHQIWTKG
jgi:hypothetical protein